jgi:hypothetical protein
MRIADEQLGSRQGVAAARFMRPQRNTGGVPTQIGLGPGEGRLRTTTDDLRQPLAALRRRAGFADRGAAGQHGRHDRARHHGAAHLFHQYDEIDETEPAAAFLLWVDDPEPTLRGELLPELVCDRRRLGHPPRHELRVALAFEKPSRRVAQQLLLLGEANVHLALSSEATSEKCGQCDFASKTRPMQRLTRCSISAAFRRISTRLARFGDSKISYSLRCSTALRTS